MWNLGVRNILGRERLTLWIEGVMGPVEFVTSTSSR